MGSHKRTLQSRLHGQSFQSRIRRRQTLGTRALRLHPRLRPPFLARPSEVHPLRHYPTYWLTVASSKLLPYTKEQIDYLAAYIIPEDVWYVEAFCGRPSPQPKS